MEEKLKIIPKWKEMKGHEVVQKVRTCAVMVSQQQGERVPLII